MKVPKNIHDFTQILFDTKDQVGAVNVLDENYQPTPPMVMGRLVPDDLLRSRFAFAGEVKLTREEVARVLISGHDWESTARAFMVLIESKLAAEEKEGER